MSETNSERYNEVTRTQWNSKAAFWDERFGEGNLFHNTLIAPAVEALLGAVEGEQVLDIATGNGAFARRLATLGAHVTAFDFSEVFLDLARRRTDEAGLEVDYNWIDGTDESALRALGERRFSAAVANMALMDMPAIEPLARALSRLLKPGGRFVFSVQHPCFNSNAISITAETVETKWPVEIVNAVKVSGYLDVPPGLGGGMPGEPNPHYYFHRPLHELFGGFFKTGFVLTGLEERSFPEQGQPLSWGGIAPQIPPILAARMVLIES